MSHLPNASLKQSGKGSAGIGAEEFNKLAGQLSGEDRVPDAPSMALLGLITMIRKADVDKADAWSPIVDAELRHLKAAVKLLTTDPRMQYRFGTSMEGAMELVGLLKARASEKDVHDSIDAVVDSDLTPQLASNSFIQPSAFVAKAKSARVAARVVV